MAGKRRYVGPNGAVFVPGPAIDKRTIAARVESGEWTPFAEPAEPKAAPARKTSRRA